MTTPTTLPDFDLAPLQGFDPAALDTTQPLPRFILVLATVFNDLKSAWYLVERVRDAGAVAAGKLAWRGQVAGMRGHLTRTIAGILHELMVYLDKHQDVLALPEFAQLLGKLDRPARAAWDEVAKVAASSYAGQTPVTSDAKLLLFIRNNLGFHYGGKRLAQGFREFFQDTSIELHERAVVSLGDSMEETRFYFADAAVEEGLTVATGLSTKDLDKRLSDIAANVNHALRFLVGTYISTSATLTPYPK
jgi:hypothetical protein